MNITEKVKIGGYVYDVQILDKAPSLRELSAKLTEEIKNKKTINLLFH